ncbi:hypothetical protein VKT23_006752 [Stygiomarasmius scandens]|uniref:Uncharacterized protein n=1 Tax=Marasmiellus scandens TaxID=2682957 RepID=A0ABR1JNL7_9AGAR
MVKELSGIVRNWGQVEYVEPKDYRNRKLPLSVSSKLTVKQWGRRFWAIVGVCASSRLYISNIETGCNRKSEACRTYKVFPESPHLVMPELLALGPARPERLAGTRTSF